MRNVYKGLMVGLAVSLLFGCQQMQQIQEKSTAIFQPQKSNDATLSEAVNDALMNNNELSVYRFHIETVNSIVTVSGYVRTIRQSDKVGEVAAKVPGVKGVKNNVIVRKY